MGRTEGLQPWRRVFHALTGIMLAALPAAPWMGRTGLLVLLGVAVLVLGTFDVVRLRRPAINRLAFEMMGSLISPREAGGPASSTWYAVSAFVVLLVFPVAVAVPAILVLALADPAASFVGRRWGRRRVGKGTVLGATAFFVVALGILLVAFRAEPAGWARALVAAALVTGAELAPLGLDDNLTVPLAAAVAVQAMLLVG